MHRFRFEIRIVLAALASVILPCALLSQEVSVAQQQAASVAQRSLTSYVQSVLNEKNFAKFGFKSFDEAQRSRLGEPYPIKIVGLKDLKAYKPETSLKTLLIDAQSLWFPVMVDDQTRTKLEMIRKPSGWVAGEFGASKSAQIVAEARAALPKLLEAKQVKAPFTVELVKIPALSASFLYVDGPSGEFMVPATINPQRFGLENATVYSAVDVLTRLEAYAKDIDEKKVM